VPTARKRYYQVAIQRSLRDLKAEMEKPGSTRPTSETNLTVNGRLEKLDLHEPLTTDD
jgi:hypothetical protein